VSTLATILIVAPQLFLAVVLHEIAHGAVALALGDPTAAKAKRLTLNPIRHIDPFMTLLLPGLLILANSPVVLGGAKPVPVNPLYFRNPRKGMALVAVAGPVTNVALAIVWFLIYLLVDPYVARGPEDIVGSLIHSSLQYGVIVNCLLAVFNLIPVPPLDGGRIAVGFLPISLARMYARLEPVGIAIVFILLLSGVTDFIFHPLIEFLAKVFG
jgi:Zn-dependent protease